MIGRISVLEVVRISFVDAPQSSNPLYSNFIDSGTRFFFLLKMMYVGLSGQRTALAQCEG